MVSYFKKKIGKQLFEKLVIFKWRYENKNSVCVRAKRLK